MKKICYLITLLLSTNVFISNVSARDAITYDTITANGVTFSNNNLTVFTATADALAKATEGKEESGKYYWEVTVDARVIGGRIGIIDENSGGAVFYQSSNSANNAIFIDQNGGSTSVNNQGFNTGDIIGVAVDLDNRNVHFYRNNTFLRTLSISNISNPYPAISNTTVTGFRTTTNFGRTSFMYRLPSGFVPYDTIDFRDEPLLSIRLVTGEVTRLGIIDRPVVDSRSVSSAALVWTSSNTGVATIDSDGVITAISSGETDITVIDSNGTFRSFLNVQVVSSDTSLPDTGEFRLVANLAVSDSLTLAWDYIHPSEVTWSSLDESVATINNNGVVTVHSKGLAIVMAERGDETRVMYIKS